LRALRSRAERLPWLAVAFAKISVI